METAQIRGRSAAEARRARAFTSSPSAITSICFRSSRRPGRTAKSALDDFLIFNQQFNTLIKAGLAHSESARPAGRARRRPEASPDSDDVRQRVRDGALLSEALEAQGSFPPVYVTVITAGERSGNLTGVLDQYISYLRVSTGFRSRLITTLIYPAVLVSTAILVVTYVVTYAMPQFADLYQDLDVPLPAPTQILLAVALPLANLFPCIFLAVIVGRGSCIFIWTRSERGALAIDRLKPRSRFWATSG